MSDHKLIFCVIESMSCNSNVDNTANLTELLTMNGSNINLFLKKMSETNWDSLGLYNCKDVHNGYGEFEEKFKMAMKHDMVPKKNDK